MEDEEIRTFPIVCRNYNPGAEFYAKSTYLGSPDNFYVVPIPEFYHMDLLTIPGAPCNCDEIFTSKTVVYDSPKSGSKLRGRILSHNSDKNDYIIFALDHGYTEQNIPIQSIYHIGASEGETVPPLAIKCQLAWCVPVETSYSDDAIETFKMYMNPKERIRVVVHNKYPDKLSVEIYNSNVDDVSSLLTYSGVAVLGF